MKAHEMVSAMRERIRARRIKAAEPPATLAPPPPVATPNVHEEAQALKP